MKDKFPKIEELLKKTADGVPQPNDQQNDQQQAPLDENISKLAAIFRFMQLYAHSAHHLTSGPTFFEDHEFFSNVCGSYEAAYDSIIERAIGTGAAIDLSLITAHASSMYAQSPPSDPSTFFHSLLANEKAARDIVEGIFQQGGYSQGTLDLFAGLSDESEVRSYKMQQRIK